MERLNSTLPSRKMMIFAFCDILMYTSFSQTVLFLLIGIDSYVSTQAMDIVALFTHGNCNMRGEASRVESSTIATMEKTSELLFSENNTSRVEFRKQNICSESEALDKLLDMFRDKDTLALIGPAMHQSLCDSMASLAEEHNKIVVSYYCVDDIRGDSSQHSYHRTGSSHSHINDISLLRTIPTSAVISLVMTNTLRHFKYKRFAIYFTAENLCWELAHSVLTSLSTEGFQLMHFIQLHTVLNRNATLEMLTQLNSDTKGRSAKYPVNYQAICPFNLPLQLIK